MPGHRRSAPWRIADLFAHEREATAYDGVVDTCLAASSITRRLGKRPQATAENVRANLLVEANVGRALEPCRENQRRFREALDAYETLRMRAAYLHDPIEPTTVLFLLLLLGLAGSLVLAAWPVVAVAALLATLTGAAIRRHPVWRMHLRHNVRELALTAVLWVREQRADRWERRWRRDLEVHGVGPLMDRIVEALLGEDRDSLLLPDSYEGLRSPRNRQYVIVSDASRRLSRKVAQLEGGTIAVSGPRGAGKSTLLETCAEEADFAVFVQAPATYSPYEFLLSLYIRVCERYLTENGHAVPEFGRLSAFRKAARYVAPAARRVSRYLAFALPAGALVVLGLAAAVRSVGLRYDDAVTGRAQDFWHALTGPAEAIWRGERAGAALVVTLTGVLLWRLRRRRPLDALMGPVRLLTVACGLLLVVASPASLFLDPDVRHHAHTLLTEPNMALPLLLGLLALLSLYLPDDLGWHPGGVTLVGNRARRAIAGTLVVVTLALLYGVSPVHAMLTDSGNPLRVACVLLGVLLVKAGGWSAPQPEPPLVRECRNQLYRLQTVQTSSSALTAGPPQLLAAHTTSLSTVPPNMPELVSDFRELLGSIAQERYARKGRVVIAIDEVDRLGSDTQALAFLSEIKAILGVPHVHYLISVAEDVGASFVRRGLPHRGVTDSSLDDIVHVQPCTLTESRAILERRAPGLSEPYSLLAHALSAGIPRDLMRYGLRIMEIEDKTRFFELTDISRQMILEELAETLAGFRTLLGKQQWNPETSAVLLSFRSLMSHLQHLCPCPSADLQRALHHVAFYDLEGQLGAASAQVPDPSRLLVDEASTYVLFSLTLLDIFGSPDFARRMASAAETSPDGNPDLLAQARQELEVSPYSARSLITAIRAAWGLAVLRPGDATAMIPRPRSTPCALHSAGA
ncbi:hypothetical protein [Streptomyces massasporeus]|uniref:hypothetical protein n=1 Tax=Streptomyces massasporeus TaxID=67324 RepID=UPI0036F9650D